MCFLSVLVVLQLLRDCREWERWGGERRGGRESMCACEKERGAQREGERERKKGRYMCVFVCTHFSIVIRIIT